MKAMYRILDVKNGQPHTLFHAVNGSRRLSLSQWLDAEVKMGQDGSGQKKRYRTGFHVVSNRPAAIDFLYRMFRHKSPRVICKVLVDECGGTWPKARSRHNITLVKRMKITPWAWAAAKRLHKQDIEYKVVA